MEKGKSQIRIGVVLSYAALFLSVAISLVYTPFMLRKLGQAEYGLFSLVNSVVANLAILDFGFENAIIRYTAKYRAENEFEKEKSLHFMFFVMYSIIGLIAFIIGLILILNIDNIFSASLTPEELSRAKTLMLIAVVNISISFPLGVFAGIIQAYEKFVFLKTANIARICLNPIIMVAILLFGYKSVGILLAVAIIGTLFSLLNMVYFYKVLNKRISVSKFDMPLLKGIGAYSFFVFLNIIIDRLYWATDQLILGMYIGTAAVAVYTIGSQFFNYYVQISTSISGVFLPRVVELDAKDADGSLLSDTFVKVGRIQFLVLSFVLSGFALFGKEFIAIWAGDGYESAYYVALITMIPSIVPLSQNVGISILQAKNMHAFRSIVYLFIAVLNVVLSVALVKPYGVVGCAAATGLGCVLGQIIIMNIYYQKKIGLDIPRYWAEIGRLSMPAAVSFAVCSLHNELPLDPGLGGLFIKGIIFSCIFMLTVWVKGMNDFEKGLLIMPLKRVLLRGER